MIKVSAQSQRDIEKVRVIHESDVVWTVAREAWVQRIRDTDHASRVSIAKVVDACSQQDQWRHKVLRQDILDLTPEAARLIRQRAVLASTSTWAYEKVTKDRIRSLLRCGVGRADVDEETGEMGEVDITGCGALGCGRVTCYRRCTKNRIEKAKQYVEDAIAYGGDLQLVTLAIRWPMPSWENDDRHPPLGVLGGLTNARWLKPNVILKHRHKEHVGVSGKSMLMDRMTELEKMRSTFGRRWTDTPVWWFQETAWRQSIREDGRCYPQPHLHMLVPMQAGHDVAIEKLWGEITENHTHAVSFKPVDKEDPETPQRLGRYLAKRDKGTPAERLEDARVAAVRTTELVSWLDDRSLSEWIEHQDGPGYARKTMGVWGHTSPKRPKKVDSGYLRDCTIPVAKVVYADATVELMRSKEGITDTLDDDDVEAMC